MRRASNEKCKQHMMEGVELLNQVDIRTLGEKETYKYLGILEGDTINKWKWKKKFKKSISEEPENYSRQNSRAGILSKG